MKTLVLYASKYGCAEDCAVYLKEKMRPGSEAVAVKNAGNLELNGYDGIVIGGSVYFGKIQKEIRTFCKQNLEKLLQKNVALFLCSATVEQADAMFQSNFPAPLLKHAVRKAHVGGELRVQNMSFIDKKLTAMIAKAGTLNPPGLSYAAMDELAALLNQQNREGERPRE